MLNKWLVAGFVFCCSANATSVSLDYSNFYNRLKEVHKNDYSLVTMGFYVPKTKDCIIKSGSITTESKTYPLSYSKHQELLLPYDENLKKDRALINLALAGDSSKCAIQIQVNSTSKLKKYNKKSLKSIYTEMNGLMSVMQGFPLKYFSQDLEGLTFHFDNKSQVKVDDRLTTTTGSFKISKKEINKLDSLSFSLVPIKISPWVKIK